MKSFLNTLSGCLFLALTVMSVQATELPKIDLVLEVQEGEGCMEVTKRGGMPLTKKECEQAAKAAGRQVLWHRPDLNRPAVILAPDLKPGEIVVFFDNRGLKKPLQGYHRVRFMTPQEAKKKGAI